MPPASYDWPAIRAANSSPRSPANTRWAWEATKPGGTARPLASTISSAGGGRAGPDGAGGPGAAARAHDRGAGGSVAGGAGPGHPALVDDQRGPGLAHE